MLDPQTDIRIDKYALEEESVSLPFLIAEYDKLWYDAHSRYNKLSAQLDNLTDKLKSLKGELAFRIKADPKFFGINEKPTDKVAENAVFIQPEYKKLSNEIYNLREDLSEAEALDNKYKNFHYALMAKKDSIDNLIRLYLNEYYSKPEKVIVDNTSKTEYKTIKSLEESSDMNSALQEMMDRRKNG